MQTIPVLLHPSHEAFHQASDACRRPVMVRGVVNQWPAFGQWDLESLEQRFGDTPAQVMRLDGGILRPDAYHGFKRLAESMRVSDFVAALRGSNDPGSFHYWTQTLGGGPFESLLNDIVTPTLINPSRMTSSNLWVGGQGLKTLLHFDQSDNVFCQVHGTKSFRLYAPEDLKYLALDPDIRTHCCSRIDPFDPDLVSFPEFAQATPFDLVVDAGDMLFVPAGWWHHVTSVTTSISVNFWYRSPMAIASRLMAQAAGLASQAQ